MSFYNYTTKTSDILLLYIPKFICIVLNYIVAGNICFDNTVTVNVT